MSRILFFIIFFICTGVGKIFLQINSAAVAFIDILIAAWEGLICQAVSKEKKFENVNLSDLGPRSMNDLDLGYSYRFMYSFS